MKYTMDGHFMCQSTALFRGCCGICIYEEKLYVAHQFEGKIEVLDLDLNLLFCVLENLKSPRHVAVASNGTIYVSDNLHSRITVWNDGNIEEFGNCKVASPAAICIYKDEYVLVADHYESCVFVFTFRGELVISIHNETIRDLFGLCIGSDGNVYIADYGGSLVTKFRLEDYMH